jgi:predicted CXXCH cytochrome family protein
MLETRLLFALSRRLFALMPLALAAAKHQISTQGVNRTVLVLLLAFPAVLSPHALAQESASHPFIEQKDIKSETCLTCHPDKKEGKFVHSAVGMGCENCHQATSEKDKTTINLVAEGGALCAMCHEAKKDDVLHGPYKNGQCLVCHDPHSSEFKAQTRAAANPLCLACHGLAPAQKVMADVFDSQKISKADLGTMPKIELDRTLRYGHPWATHPVSEIADPLHAGQKMSCLSCHTPHASAQENLIVAVKGPGTVCTECHKVIDETAAAKSKAQPTPPAQPQPPQKADAAKPQADKEKP